MSVEDSLESFTENASVDDTARLLSQLCPDFIKNNVEYGLGSPESFACLLYRNNSLFDAVKDASISRDFHDIWDHCIQICTLKRLKPFITIPEVLSELSHGLTKLVNNQIESPLWTLSEEHTFKDAQTITKCFTLNALMEQKRVPSMLFYDLGSFRNKSILHQRLQKLFCKKQNTFLVNASATGKTRLLYEGLFQHWGIYVTAHADDQEAQALETTMGTSFGGENEMVGILPDVSVLGYQKLLDDNLKLLYRRFSIVLLVHLLVFREFLKIAHTEHVIDNQGLHRHWLLAQLWGPCLREWENDVHRELVQILEWEPLTIIDDELTKIIEEVNLLLPEAIRREGLFVAIDEANVAAGPIWYDPTEVHPPIRSLVRTWRDHLASLDCSVTFVVAGTEIDPNCFPSTSSEWSSWKWTSDTGSFDDSEVQKAYILPFLPPSFSETPSGKVLFQRIWNWCRPRYRLTTAFIRMLIEDKVTHPHGVLNRYIQRLISYEATDASEYITEEGPCKTIPFFNCVGPVLKSSVFARSATHEVVFHYIITGKHPPFYDISRLALVTSGVGQFKDTDMQVIAMDQPGLTIAAAIWLGRDQEQVGGHFGGYNDKTDELQSLRLFKPFSFFFNLLWSNGDNYSPACYIATYLAHAFVNGRCMSDVFAIPAPLWLEDLRMLAYLVVLHKDKKGNVQELLVGPSELLPTSPPLGYIASTSNDVIAWIRQERTGAFCLCPPDCWADLIFVLKLDEKYVWVVLSAAGQGIQLDTKDLYLEFERLTEQNMFSRTTNASDITVNQIRFSEALKLLPNTLAPPGSFPMLRVLASFPDEPSLPRCNLAQKITGGPVSILKLDTFKSVTEAFSPEDLVEGLVSSMHDKRSSYSDDSFTPINSASSSRARKRKNVAAAGQTPAGRLSPRKAVLKAERLIRPIPHKTPVLPSPDVEPPSANQFAKEVAPVRQNKRAKRDAKSQRLSESLTPAPLRRSPREHRSKD